MHVYNNIKEKRKRKGEKVVRQIRKESIAVTQKTKVYTSREETKTNALDA